MSRLDEALARLRSGEPAILMDENRADICTLVCPADSVAAGARDTMVDDRRSEPVLWIDAAPDGALGAEDEGDTRRRIDRLGLSARAIAPHGVLGHPAEAEAAVDAVRLAGRYPAAVLAGLRVPDGILARENAACALAVRRGLPLFSIQDVIAERLCRETIVDALASAHLPSRHADVPLDVQAFRGRLDGVEHLALIHRPFGPEPLVRLHSECLTGDALGSLRCDCGEQLRHSLRLVTEHPDGGIVLYLRGHEGRGIGLANKIRAYALQDLGRDTVEANIELGFPADLRSYGIAVQMLRALGISSLRLLSNNPDKARSLERYGIRVSERVPLRIDSNIHNAAYLDTKRRKMGHDLAVRLGVAE